MRPFGCHVGDVCFVHWPVDPGVLDTRLPHALSVATREGTGWVSLLAMRTRPRFGPVPLPGEFSQVTLRTYVRAGEANAVYFLRVDTDSRLATLGARNVFGVAFRRVDARVTAGGGTVQVRTHAPDGTALYDATFDRGGDPRPVESDSLVGWLTDRDTYALEDGRTGRVEHDPWRLAAVDVNTRTDYLLRSEGLSRPESDPVVRYSPGATFALTEWPS